MPPNQGQMEDLASVRIAKELFLSDWYTSACDSLQFRDEACDVLERISGETERERATLLNIMRDWSNEAPESAASQIIHVNRLEFLRTIYEAKTAAGLAVERIAAHAPPRIAERLLNAAAVDFKHATSVQRLIEQEVEALVRVAAEPRTDET